MLTVLSLAGIPLSLLDDSVSLEEYEDFFGDEELELSSLSSLIPTSSLSLGVLVGNAVAMLQMKSQRFRVHLCVVRIFVSFLHVCGFFLRVLVLPLATLRCWCFRCYPLCSRCPFLLCL